MLSTLQDKIINLGPSLDRRIAFVTGGFGGIGRACVLSLLAHGARVAFTYAGGRESDQIARAFADEYPGRLSAHPLDLLDVGSIRSCVRDAFDRWNGLHILVNNAAVGSTTVAAYSDDLAVQDYVMFDINADGALKVCQTFLTLVQTTSPSEPCKIINLSSVGGGVQVFPGFRLSDGMSKAAVAFLTRQLAAGLIHTPIDVFAVCPGATDTPMFYASTLAPMAQEDRRSFISSLPKGRLLQPQDIANVVAFLASGYSTPLHGAVIDASMGLGVRPGVLTERPH